MQYMLGVSIFCWGWTVHGIVNGGWSYFTDVLTIGWLGWAFAVPVALAVFWLTRHLDKSREGR